MKALDYPFDEAAASYPPSPALPPFDQRLLALHGVDAHCLVMDSENTIARCSLWWNDVPAIEGERLGVVGHFEASSEQAAAMLVSHALHRLMQQGCTLAVGPMDGNTWRRYRFVTERESEPPFFLEPENPEAYPRYFLDAGFTPMAQYSSALVTDLSVQDARIPRAIERLKAAGVRWRTLDMERFEDELRAIYRLSLQSFAANFLYTPISEKEFLAQYLAVASYVQPELVLMAEQAGELIGFLFSIPDVNQARRGETVDTVIVKTVAVLPGRRCAGLGGVLVAESHRIAREQGYRRAIHALMHERNQSRNISAHYSRTMRRYTLYQLRLGPGR